ncbi:MAG: hypothetical protein HYY18_05610 [Planctomycetes bacterium]|nr:hypothetical protein [Planctomycetota bacterium]
MSCELRQTLRFHLVLLGGMTETIFPEAESMLQEREYQRALRFVASRKAMDRYFSVMDFLFCEIFTQYRPGALAFYQGEGPRLLDVLSESQRAWFDRVLVRALALAHRRFAEQREATWESFRWSVLKAAV